MDLNNLSFGLLGLITGMAIAIPVFRAKLDAIKGDVKEIKDDLRKMKDDIVWKDTCDARHEGLDRRLNGLLPSRVG